MPLFVPPKGGWKGARARRARKGHSGRRGRNALNTTKYRHGRARRYRLR